MSPRLLTSPTVFIACAFATNRSFHVLSVLLPADCVVLICVVFVAVKRFDEVSETLAPVDDGTADRCFISESYDATRYLLRIFFPIVMRWVNQACSLL